ncbi:hypothetical protein [Azospirillum largimobile]
MRRGRAQAKRLRRRSGCPLPGSCGDGRQDLHGCRGFRHGLHGFFLSLAVLRTSGESDAQATPHPCNPCSNP